MFIVIGTNKDLGNDSLSDRLTHTDIVDKINSYKGLTEAEKEELIDLFLQFLEESLEETGQNLCKDAISSPYPNAVPKPE
jgi:hypothetical protein